MPATTKSEKELLLHNMFIIFDCSFFCTLRRLTKLDDSALSDTCCLMSSHQFHDLFQERHHQEAQPQQEGHDPLEEVGKCRDENLERYHCNDAWNRYSDVCVCVRD